MESDRRNYSSLILWVVAFEAISMIIGRSTQGSVQGWYKTLTPPPLTPPDIVFPVMWTILYAVIGTAGWMIWRHRKAEGGNYLAAVFAVYMGLNWGWSFVFFGGQLLLGGFLWILALNSIALIFIIMAWQYMRKAALLMIVPTVWTFFAAYLNGGYWILNS